MGIGVSLLWNVSYALHTNYVPSSRGIFVYKLETSIPTKIVSWPIFVFSIKLIKSVVSFMLDCCFCAIGRSNVSTKEDIL